MASVTPFVVAPVSLLSLPPYLLLPQILTLPCGNYRPKFPLGVSLPSYYTTVNFLFFLLEGNHSQWECACLSHARPTLDPHFSFRVKSEFCDLVF